MDRLNCNIETLSATINEYFKVGARKGTHLRLGQFIWNRHGNPDKSWPELFYTESDSAAISLAYAELGAEG
jgi:hypothetical protein